MSKIATFVYLLKNNRKSIYTAFMQNFARSSISRFIPDKLFLKMWYRARIGRRLNLKEPETFNEKIQWLKLYDHNPIYPILVDKYDVKQYISDTIGKEYVIPTIGVWDRVEDIDFSSLPDQFVLKCTHDSGSTIVCKNKLEFNPDVAKEKLKYKLSKSMFWWGREWAYKEVKPRIICEKYISDSDEPGNHGDELTDYKFMCFNGKMKCAFTGTNRFKEGGLRVTFFDREWNRMPFIRHYPAADEDIPKPVQYKKMMELAEKLSVGIPFVRVDFYETCGKVFFGELTLYPGCGFEEFSPEEWDYKLGEWLVLPERKTK